jgi:type VII secretion-associated serine protease mycosin
MRPAAVILAAATAIGGLSLAGLPAHAASYGSPVVAPKGGCQNQPQKAKVWDGTVPAQDELDAERVWPISTGANVTVAVLDSGVDTSHDQLRGADIANGADFLHGNGGGTGKRDCDGHGTAVTSLIVAQKVNGVSFQGLAYDAKILPVVVSERHDDGPQEGRGETTSPEKLAKAIDWSVNQGAKVINLSLTLTKDNPAVKRAVDNAVNHDVVVVAAAGNGARKADPAKGDPGSPGPRPYPAAYDGVIGVGAVSYGAPLEKSQYGDYVDIAAPGNVFAAALKKGHVGMSGTSFAAAYVSASAALLRSKWPEMKADEVTRRLLATAGPGAGSRAKTGAGVVNPYRALTEGLSDDDPAEPVGMTPQSPDPAAVARSDEWEFSGNMALVGTVIGIVLAGAALATLTLLPLGRRRRWHPGRAKPFPEPEEDDMPPAPVKLFEDLEAH